MLSLSRPAVAAAALICWFIFLSNCWKTNSLEFRRPAEIASKARIAARPR